MNQNDLMAQLHTIQHGGSYEVREGAFVRVEGPPMPAEPGAGATAEGGAGAAVGAAIGEPPSPPEDKAAPAAAPAAPARQPRANSSATKA